MNFSQTYLEKPEGLPAKWVDAWNKRDAIALANLFADDAEFVNVVGFGGTIDMTSGKHMITD